MTNVVLFPRHRLYRCGGCDPGCYSCRGGLKCCVTCGGAEASLPTHCPQARMDAMMATCVQQGSADFRDGEWHYGLFDVARRSHV